VRDCDLREARLLDCGGGERVPTLQEALAVMLPTTLPLIEHKAGDAPTYVAALSADAALEHVILQSFDWRFLEEVRRLEPRIALGALGPNPYYPHPDDDALALLASFGAGLVHWGAAALRRQDVERAHAAGLLVCSYTTDDELGWLGGRAMGIDVMCSNDPARMTAVIQGS
jgi:glycerophosphoryl diester phosphodiesterase